MKVRLLVCGGRNYSDTRALTEVLSDLFLHFGGIECLIHGGAAGADRIAAAWAQGAGIEILCFGADWKKHGLAAGPIRNQRMIDEGRPNLVVAAKGGRGTADMVARANNAGLAVVLVGDAPEAGQNLASAIFKPQ